ncbi:hypothetical protein BDW59DRAFT_158363 [Aspergillus cavernicola]|uniref:Altered inheritance of mitochondria protein 9, mitochondrial n=1 Tax=Aspergillus cavernicola TaxID=176166 RepID=A0ABR4IRQ2_9EURO
MLRKIYLPREELFPYTNGWFLVHEQRQLHRRYVKLDIDALYEVACAAGDEVPSRITSIEKLEGGFSKALLMKKETGTEVIVKIPFRIAGPTVLTTAPEVGVLDYVRQYTEIPVPRVLSWSAEGSNPVGAQYDMEKAAGVQLYQQWGGVSEYEKLQLIKNLTKLEAHFSAMSFPAYGALYRREDADGRFEYSTLDGDTDCSTLVRLAIGGSVRSLVRPMGLGTMEEKSHLLRLTQILMPYLDSNSALRHSSQPTLWHTHLHMGNIFVSHRHETEITSLIDFQSLSVLPAFLQAQWPVFLKLPSNYARGLAHPKLPADFEDMDKENITLAREELQQAKLAKAYEVSSYLQRKSAHTAMDVPPVFRELFTRCGEVSDMGVIPLRACLIEVFENWSNLEFSGECPFSFTGEDIELHERQFADYQAWHNLQQLVQECLDTDAEGWVDPRFGMCGGEKAE